MFTSGHLKDHSIVGSLLYESLAPWVDQPRLQHLFVSHAGHYDTLDQEMADPTDLDLYPHHIQEGSLESLVAHTDFENYDDPAVIEGIRKEELGPPKEGQQSFLWNFSLTDNFTVLPDHHRELEQEMAKYTLTVFSSVCC